MLVACRLAGLSAIGAQLCVRQIAGNAGRRSTSNIEHRNGWGGPACLADSRRSSHIVAA